MSVARPTKEVVEAADQGNGKINLNQEDVKNGLGQLVLTLVELIHQLLEKQAIRRMENGSLTEEEIERIGFTLMKQAEEIERLCSEFNLEKDDLNLDLGPLGRLL
ncbi:MAG: gas vesicle protein K [Proteobacteria bacterium]|nr:gas vesicle protein K [Pseudomonadota bacterium]